MKTMESLNKPVILFDIDYTIFNTAHFKESNLLQYRLYVEVNDILARLVNIAILGIFSEGETKFQMNKLKATKIDHFFQEEHILIDPQKEKRIKEVGEKYKNTRLFTIDDKLPMLSSIKKSIPQVKTIWIKRGPYAENQKPIPDFTPDAVVDNLSELIPLINLK